MDVSDGVSDLCSRQWSSYCSVRWYEWESWLSHYKISESGHCCLPRRQFLRRAMNAGTSLMAQRPKTACFLGPALRLLTELIFPGKAVIRTSSPHMDLESASLLLMSTSSSRSFAFMCLYSLYSSAIGVRSSFWTFLPFCLKKLSSKSWSFFRIIFFSSLISWRYSKSSGIEAEWRFERPESWLHFDGILSSIGEINPSASSSSCSRKQCALQSVFSVTVKSGLVELSSSDASSCS